MEKKINEIIEKIRPFLQIDGGDIEYVGYEDNYIYVKLLGNCVNCASQDSTINDTLFTYFKDEIPELEGIINVSF